MKRTKTNHTARTDGRIVLTKVINGKRKYFYGRTDEEAERKYAEYIAPPPIKLHEIADAWLEDKTRRISPNTLPGFTVATNRIIDEFGDLTPPEISVAQIFTFLERFRAQGYSQKVITNTRSVFKMIMDRALAAGIIVYNPVLMVPTVRGAEKVPRQPATDRELEIIEQYKTESISARFYYFVLYTGLRRSEALCLRNSDIDRERAVVTVSKSVAFEGSRPVIKSPKTAAGVREVHIPPNVLEILPRGKPKALLWFSGAELPSKSRVESFINEFRKAHNLSCTLHQLRHNYASLLHTSGVDVKDAQYLLGHANITVTQDIYTHIESNRRRDIAAKLDSEILTRVRPKE